MGEQDIIKLRFEKKQLEETVKALKDKFLPGKEDLESINTHPTITMSEEEEDASLFVVDDDDATMSQSATNNNNDEETIAPEVDMIEQTVEFKRIIEKKVTRKRRKYSHKYSKSPPKKWRRMIRNNRLRS